MYTSQSIIRKVLEWASVVLDEVYPVMTSSEDQVASNDVAAAKQAVDRLTTYEQQALQKASDKVTYEELVKKLQAKEMPITPEEWQRSIRLD